MLDELFYFYNQLTTSIWILPGFMHGVLPVVVIHWPEMTSQLTRLFMFARLYGWKQKYVQSLWQLPESKTIPWGRLRQSIFGRATILYVILSYGSFLKNYILIVINKKSVIKIINLQITENYGDRKVTSVWVFIYFVRTR
jgi:hypothetical protein